jgi:putative transposase
MSIHPPRGPCPTPIDLTPRQRSVLEKIVRHRKSPQALVVRSRVILHAASGMRNEHIAAALPLSSKSVWKWRRRWLEAAVQWADVEAEVDEPTWRGLIHHVLSDAPRSGCPGTFTPEQICQIVVVACESPQAGGRPLSHWTLSTLADEVVKRGLVERISLRTIGRFLKRSRSQTPSDSLLAS